MSLFSPRLLLKTVLAFLLLVFLAYGVAAQTGADACHVYVVDLAKSTRALKTLEKAESEEAVAKALSAAQTIFPEFRPAIGEEELTTKHYSFPGSKLVITASVYYTDESMASHGEGAASSRNDSMLIGITVANRGKASAIEPQAGNAITEVTYDQHTNKIRAKQHVKVRGRMYLVGIECDCMSDKKPR
jgi:transposase-like protein